MAEHCRNCGTELLAGQRFCRLCGTPVSDAQREELPTKVFRNERQAGVGGARPADTAQTSQSMPNTDPFSPFQQPTAPQSPVAHQQTTPLYLPPDQASSKGRSMMFLVIGLVGLALLSVLLLIWNFRQPVPARTAPRAPAQTEIPVPPPPPPPPVGDAAEGLPLDESDAVEKDNETVITKTYMLDNDATFSMREMNGNVEIEGWDESEAEVKIIKRGGSIEDRKRVRINSSHTEKRLSFQTSPIGNGEVEVRYQVKLPRGLGRVDINTVNGGVKIEEMAGAVEVKAQNGSVELSNVSGASAIKLVNGQIKADYEGVEIEGPQQLGTVNGKIEVKLDDDADVDVKANTVSGSINLDGDFGFKVEKKLVGQQASGRVGQGGPLLSISTVNGPIKINR